MISDIHFIRYFLVIFSCCYIFVSRAEDLESKLEEQRFKHQIQIGYGVNYFNRVYPLFFSKTNSHSDENNKWDFRPRTIKNEKTTIISSINLYYHVRIKERGSFGITATSDFYKRTYQTYSNNSLIPMKETMQIYTLMPNLYYHYLNNKKVRLYFGMEAGLMFLKNKSKESNIDITSKDDFIILPTFNFSPFGLRLKYKVSPYIQLNIGSRGFIEGGISYGFGQ